MSISRGLVGHKEDVRGTALYLAMAQFAGGDIHIKYGAKRRYESRTRCSGKITHLFFYAYLFCRLCRKERVDGVRRATTIFEKSSVDYRHYSRDVLKR